MNAIPKTKAIALLLGIILLVVIIYVSTLSVSRSGKTPVSFSVYPSDATILLEGEEIGAGTNYLDTGIYQLRVEREGFKPYEKTVVLEEDKQTVAVILTPDSQEAIAYGKENEKEYLKVQAQAEVATGEAGKTFHDANPIAKDLPYKTFFYSVGYRMDQSDPSGNSIIIEIDAPEGYRQSALYRIRQLGYDPTDFTINFRDYENPFAL